MTGHRALVAVAVYATSLCIVSAADYSYNSDTTNTSPPPNPNWTLDPYLGTYDFIFAQGHNAIELIHGVLGVPLEETIKGERQVFNKTADGHYQQGSIRADPFYNSLITFDLGKPGSARIDNDTATYNYKFDMVTQNTLRGAYEIIAPTITIQFTIMFYFYEDASGLFITNTLTKPIDLIETGPFYRVKAGDTVPLTAGPPPCA